MIEYFLHNPLRNELVHANQLASQVPCCCCYVTSSDVTVFKTKDGICRTKSETRAEKRVVNDYTKIHEILTSFVLCFDKKNCELWLIRNFHGCNPK